jgi:LacI family transcriptional regulator
VSLDRTISKVLFWPSIILLEVGCKKIAHIYGPQENITGKERLMGYEKAVKNFSWYSPSLMVPGYFEIDGGKKAAEILLHRHPSIDGIFAGNDLMAVGALKVLLQNGVKVPEQVAICGFDDIRLTEIMEPELSTVAQPIYEMGELAADILIQRIKGELKENMIYELDVTLIPRKSSRLY